MMMSSRLVGLMAVIPITMLLTVSFFVLFTVSKTENKGLKKFGWTAAVLLWISAFMFFCGGMITTIKGPAMMGMAQHRMNMMEWNIGKSGMMTDQQQGTANQ